jgi:hypothetical protein
VEFQSSTATYPRIRISHTAGSTFWDGITDTITLASLTTLTFQGGLLVDFS